MIGDSRSCCLLTALLFACGSHATTRGKLEQEPAGAGCLESDCPCLERTVQGLFDENGVAALDVVRPLLVAIEKRCPATRASEAALLLGHKTSAGRERVLHEYAFFTGTCLSRQEAQQRCLESTPDDAICDAVRRKW